MRFKNGKVRGDHTMVGIGPYDYWAIEFGYSFATDLKPILARVAEPELTAQTKIIARSEWLGFPPIVARTDRMNEPPVKAFRAALLGLSGTAPGKEALRLLSLDGMAPAEQPLFDGIAARMAVLAGG